MKKFICTFLCALLLATGIHSFAANPVTVTLDYADIHFSQPPVIQNDRTLVPLRAIFEAMGASVTWNGETKTITSALDDTTVVMTLGDNTMLVNKTEKVLDCAPQLIGERTLVPVRAVAESFGCDVKWDASTRNVSILSPSFMEKALATEDYRSTKEPTHDNITATSNFCISLFDGYETKKHTADGTDLEITHTTDAGHVALTIRSDMYFGADVPLTESYAQSVADSMVSVVSGTLLSCGVQTLNGDEFIEIRYTAPRTVFGIQDQEADITVYMGRKDGIVYTMTLAVYGTVDRAVVSDFYYMMHSLLIA